MTVEKINFMLGLCAGFILGAYLGPSKTERVIEKPTVVQGKTEYKTNTKIVYVEKEVNPVTGGTENTDIQADIAQADIVVKLNGIEYPFNKTQEEQQVFEKNKLVLSQNSRVSFDIDVKPQVIDKTKANSVAALLGVYGVGIGYRHNKIGIDAYIPYVGGYGVAARYDVLQW